MATKTIELVNFFDGDIYRTEKVRQLTALISRSAYDAGLDVDVTTDGDRITVLITADQITNAHLCQLGMLINEAYRTIPNEFATRH